MQGDESRGILDDLQTVLDGDKVVLLLAVHISVLGIAERDLERKNSRRKKVIKLPISNVARNKYVLV